MMKRFFFSIIFSIPYFLLSGYPVLHVGEVSADDRFDQDLRQLGILTEVLHLIQNEYVDEEKTSTQELIQHAIQGMVSSLDRYSVFLTPEEAKEFDERTQGTFQGLGIQYDIIGQWLTVIEPIPGTPAATAGLIGGDRIIEIDGVPTKGISLEKAAALLQGEVGTDAKLLISRNGEALPVHKSVTRARIETLSVETSEKKMLDHSTGYIRLRDFTDDAAEELETGIRELQNQGMRNLILDLRDNVGGRFDVAVDVCDLFLPEDTLIVSQKDRQGRVKRFHAKRPATGNYLLAVLLNEFTASAAEIVAGCLQDHRRAVLFGPAGHTTFGKGSVQSEIKLNNLPGAAVKITTDKYFTPKDRSIDDLGGITPDIPVAVSETRRVLIRRENKMGYIPEEWISAQTGAPVLPFPNPVAPGFDRSAEVEEDPAPPIIYDIELFTAYQVLKGNEIFQTHMKDQYSFVNPWN